MPTTLITGASQGLGLELTRQYAGAGWRVIACCRRPEQASGLRALPAAGPPVEVAQLDVTDAQAIAALAARLGDDPIDLLLNNAGIIGPLPLRENLYRQHFGTIDYGTWEQVLETNLLGPVRMTEAFVEHVAASTQRLVVTLSSTTGSIAESRRAALAYTSSKAALNKAMTVIADQLSERGITVALLCPGYVKTRMDLGGAALSPEESVSGMRNVIASLRLEDTGCFRRYNGDTIAW